MEKEKERLGKEVDGRLLELPRKQPIVCFLSLSNQVFFTMGGRRGGKREEKNGT